MWSPHSSTVPADLPTLVTSFLTTSLQWSEWSSEYWVPKVTQQAAGLRLTPAFLPSDTFTLDLFCGAYAPPAHVAAFLGWDPECTSCWDSISENSVHSTPSHPPTPRHAPHTWKWSPLEAKWKEHLRKDLMCGKRNCIHKVLLALAAFLTGWRFRSCLLDLGAAASQHCGERSQPSRPRRLSVDSFHGRDSFTPPRLLSTLLCTSTRLDPTRKISIKP